MKTKLSWKRGAFSTTYQVFSGDRQIAYLKNSAFKQTSEGSIHKKKVKFHTKGVFKQETQILDGDSHKLIGSISYNSMMTKATIQLSDRSIFWKYDNGWQTNLYYNVQGETLQVVGTGDVPDAYTIPFHSLDFIVNKSFGKDFNSTINLSVKNILDSDREVRYQSFGAEDQIFSKFSPGVGISLGYSHRF